jgi:hypothetical protein
VISGATPVAQTPALGTTIASYVTSWSIPTAIPILSTDRIIIRVVAINSSSSARNASWQYQGTSNASYVDTNLVIQGVYGATGYTGYTGYTGPGLVTAVSVATANGVSGTSSGGATPALTIALGAITPSTVNTLTVGLGNNSIAGNTAVGVQSLAGNNSGTGHNTALGYFSLYNNTSGNKNTAIGDNTLSANTTGVGSVALGYMAGTYNTDSDSFYVDNQDRGSTAGDKAGALLYGTFNATPTSQTLKVNGALTVGKVIQTVTPMGAQALDGTLGNIFTRTLGASETFTQSGFSAGQCFMVVVKQGTGQTYTVTWFATVTWLTSGGTAPVQTTVSNGYTSYGFRCTGSNTFEGYLIATN